MAMIWFRLHTEILDDPKIQTLDPKIYKIYINTLCHAARREKNGNIGTIFDVSYALRETKSTVSSAFHTLEELGLIETVGETFHIPQWKKKQYKSDTSTERVKKHRAKVKRSRNVTVTAPEQSRTDTDTEKNIKKKNKTNKLEKDFGEFWELCLRKEAKAQALINYKKARKNTDKDLIHNSMKAYSDNCINEDTEKQFIKRPSNWLTAGMYNDQLEMNGHDPLKQSDGEWRARIKGYKRNGGWHDEWGFKPDENGNDIPEAILKENNYQTFTNNRSE